MRGSITEYIHKEDQPKLKDLFDYHAGTPPEKISQFDKFVRKSNNHFYVVMLLASCSNEDPGYHYEEIVEIRGAGLLLGIKTKKNNVMISNLLKQKKLLTVPAGDNVIRLAPPLIINKKHADEAISIINQTFKKII